MENKYSTDIQKAPFLYLNAHPSDFHAAMKRTLDKTSNKQSKPCDEYIFKNTFFSAMNVEIINNRIKKTVYNNTCNKYIVPNQKHEHLFQIMDYIFGEYSQNLDRGQKEQMEILDRMVVDFAVDLIIEEIKTRSKYLRDKFSKPRTLPDPINTSSSGTKTFAPLLSTKYDDYDMYADQRGNGSNPINSTQNREHFDDIYNKQVILDSVNTQESLNNQMNYKQCNRKMFE